ncbi:SAP domain [Phaffia rhodozyma]|uniref:SAP domain n=1 Tax=Phaffia rhodozyma TaxID=264483 RepID=A0A0F7SMJ6_PHARH|nr:SAP domain [Phaffia rhodozyma]
MLRSTRSLGSLRAVAQVQAQPHFMLPAQQRQLASSVLLSQGPWEKQTVSQLKGELSKRNIAIGGSKLKKDLIRKLQEFEQAQQIPPVPSRRQASTSATKETTVSAEDALKVRDNGPAISTEKLSVPPSIPVASQAIEPALGGDILVSDTVAPGLPENPFGQSKMTLDLKFPDSRDQPESATPIPWILAFHSDKFPSTSDSPSQSQVPEAFVPKVYTAASTSTHPGGGPVSGTSTTSDLGIEDPLVSAEETSRDLSSAEKQGLFVLAAILAGGFLAGGVFKPQSKAALAKAEELAHQAKDKAGELKDQAQEKTGELKAQVEDKYAEVKGKAEDLVKDGKAKLAEGKNAAEGKYDEAKGKAKEVAKEGQKKIEEGKAKGKKAVEDVKEKVGAK